VESFGLERSEFSQQMEARPGAARFGAARVAGSPLPPAILFLRQAKEQQAVPLGAGDLLGDRAQRLEPPALLVDQVLLPNLETGFASCQECIPPGRESGGSDGVLAAERLQVSPTEQFDNDAHFVVGRPPAAAVAAGFRGRFSRPPGSFRAPGNRRFGVGHTDTLYPKSVSNETVGRGRAGYGHRWPDHELSPRSVPGGLSAYPIGTVAILVGVAVAAKDYLCVVYQVSPRAESLEPVAAICLLCALFSNLYLPTAWEPWPLVQAGFAVLCFFSGLSD